MALDGLVTHALVEELQRLSGAKINKIHQPARHDIVIQARSQGQNVRLLLSANPTYPRVHLTDRLFINPMEAPMFCMLLRKHCENGMIERIEQIGSERIIHIHIVHRDELEDLRPRTIIVELTGRHSNIILFNPDTQTVLDGIHHVTPAISSHRILLPGSRYVMPPDQNKPDPLHIDRQQVNRILSDLIPDAADKASLVTNAHFWEQALVDGFSGVSPLVAREIVYRSVHRQRTEQKTDPIDNPPAQLASHLWAVIEQIRSNRTSPNIVTLPSGKSSFSVIELTHLDGETIRYPTVSACLDAYYSDKAERDKAKQRVSDLMRLLQNHRSKNVTKLAKLQDTIEETKDADRYRIAGELLTASLHLVNKGETEVEVINYYDDNQAAMRITLDRRLSPSDNAQRYFKKYAKLKNSVAVVEEQIAAAREEIRYLDSLLQQLDSAAPADIEEIREELIEQGYVRNRGKKLRKKRKNDKPALTCFTSGEDIPIYVGKNNTQNEYLTNRLAHPSDTWLHTKDIPGSHVVIRSSRFNDETLLEAAMLAAYFSQARESSQIPVDYTLIRHVRKPGGAKPGYVIYERQKTLYVTPDEQRIKQMKQMKK